MFLIDKYRITDLYNILYHKDIYEKLFEKKDYQSLIDEKEVDAIPLKMKNITVGNYNNFPNKS